MAHGRKDEGDLLAVMAHIGRLIMKLGHQNQVTRRVGIGETGEARRQLIAQHKDEVADRVHQKAIQKALLLKKRSKKLLLIAGVGNQVATTPGT
jgi:hypothetical protein